MRLLLSWLLALMLAGCATREVGTIRPAPGVKLTGEEPAREDGCVPGKVVWITIDGTSNTPVSRTAAVRLHEMVEAYSYHRPGRRLAIWYAEGVGSADRDLLGKALGVGVDEDIKKAYAFLTRVWKPCDRLFLNGFSRGAYSVRALGGLLYMAGIPDLSAKPEAERKAIVDELFDAYKTRNGYPGHEVSIRAAQRVAAVYERHGLDRLAGPGGMPGFRSGTTRVTIEAITVWDSVQAMGKPDRGEDPTEGPKHFLVTACNAKAIFQPLSLDDNRVYSFTPILAGGAQSTAACPERSGRQNVSKVVDEVWFSGAHADVGGTYEAGGMLDGELASVSLNWVLDRLRSDDCKGCGDTLALPEKLRVPEDRMTAIHDGKRSSIAYLGLYRQSRKPLVYWHHVYGSGRPAAVHVSVFERLERLFALDETIAGCKEGTTPPGKPVICAEEIASYSLVPELVKGECLEATDWGYRIKEGTRCVEKVGEPSREPLPDLPTCQVTGPPGFFEGRVYKGGLETANRWVVRTEKQLIPYPRCVTE